MRAHVELLLAAVGLALLLVVTCEQVENSIEEAGSVREQLDGASLQISGGTDLMKLPAAKPATQLTSPPSEGQSSNQAVGVGRGSQSPSSSSSVSLQVESSNSGQASQTPSSSSGVSFQVESSDSASATEIASTGNVRNSASTTLPAVVDEHAISIARHTEASFPELCEWGQPCIVLAVESNITGSTGECVLHRQAFQMQFRIPIMSGSPRAGKVVEPSWSHACNEGVHTFTFSPKLPTTGTATAVSSRTSAVFECKIIIMSVQAKGPGFIFVGNSDSRVPSTQSSQVLPRTSHRSSDPFTVPVFLMFSDDSPVENACSYYISGTITNVHNTTDVHNLRRGQCKVDKPSAVLKYDGQLEPGTSWELNALVMGRAVKGSGVVFTVEEPVSASASVVYSEGDLRAGSDISVLLRSKAHSGRNHSSCDAGEVTTIAHQLIPWGSARGIAKSLNDRTSDSAEGHVPNSHGVRVEGQISECERGLYQVGFVISAAGLYEFPAKIQGESVGSSPFKQTILPGQPALNKFYLDASEMEDGVTVGIPATIRLWPADAFGNAVPCEFLNDEVQQALAQSKLKRIDDAVHSLSHKKHTLESSRSPNIAAKGMARSDREGSQGEILDPLLPGVPQQGSGGAGQGIASSSSGSDQSAESEEDIPMFISLEIGQCVDRRLPVAGQGALNADGGHHDGDGDSLDDVHEELHMGESPDDSILGSDTSSEEILPLARAASIPVTFTVPAGAIGLTVFQLLFSGKEDSSTQLSVNVRDFVENLYSQVKAAPVEGSNSKASGPGLKGGVPLLPSHFSIQLYDTTGQPSLKCSGISIDVSLVGPRKKGSSSDKEGSTKSSTSLSSGTNDEGGLSTGGEADLSTEQHVQQSSCKAGNYGFELRPMVKGEYLLFITVMGKRVEGSPFHPVFGFGCSRGDISQELKCSGQGKCNSNGKCECEEGYVGESCQIPCPVHEGRTCSGKGQCKLDGTCHCDHGWAGESCFLECPGGANNPCSGAGTCLADATCECKEGREGADCGVVFYQLKDAGKMSAMAVIAFMGAVVIIAAFCTVLKRQVQTRAVNRYAQLDSSQPSACESALLRVMDCCDSFAPPPRYDSNLEEEGL